MKNTLSAFLLIFLFSACASPQQTTAATAEPTSTPLQPTATTVPTQTQPPTETPLPTSAFTPTPEPGVQYGYVGFQHVVEWFREIFGEDYESMDPDQTIRIYDRSGNVVPFGIGREENGHPQEGYNRRVYGVYMNELIFWDEAGVTMIPLLVPSNEGDYTSGDVLLPMVPYHSEKMAIGLYEKDTLPGSADESFIFPTVYGLSGTDLREFLTLFGDELTNVQIGFNLLVKNPGTDADFVRDYDANMQDVLAGLASEDNDGEMVEGVGESPGYVPTGLYVPVEAFTDEMITYLEDHNTD